MDDDNSPEKKLRGGQRRVNPRLVVGTANALRTQFSVAWRSVGNQLLSARSPEQVMAVLKKDGGAIGGLKDLEFSTRVFEVIRDPKFPNLRSKSQVNFLADSLAASGLVTFRRSREICAQERRKVRHVIVRREFYIECTCGYSGPAFHGACPECGTGEISEELMRREEYAY
jgi:hypothetical protein